MTTYSQAAEQPIRTMRNPFPVGASERKKIMFCFFQDFLQQSKFRRNRIEERAIEFLKILQYIKYYQKQAYQLIKFGFLKTKSVWKKFPSLLVTFEKLIAKNSTCFKIPHGPIKRTWGILF